MTLDSQWAMRWMREAEHLIEMNHGELTALDKAIGDGDHGDNMLRAFQAVTRALDGGRYETAGQVLRATAKIVMSTVGGAAGPLYGSAFLRGASVTDTDKLGAEHLCAFFESALDAIQVRGKAQTGEKTMVDVWAPAYYTAREEANAGADEATILRRVAHAAAAAALATSDLVATKGRASYFGAQSVGHIDPGAYSTALILQAAAAALTTMEGQA